MGDVFPLTQALNKHGRWSSAVVSAIYSSEAVSERRRREAGDALNLAVFTSPNDLNTV